MINAIEKNVEVENYSGAIISKETGNYAYLGSFGLNLKNKKVYSSSSSTRSDMKSSGFYSTKKEIEEFDKKKYYKKIKNEVSYAYLDTLDKKLIFNLTRQVEKLEDQEYSKTNYAKEANLRKLILNLRLEDLEKAKKSLTFITDKESEEYSTLSHHIHSRRCKFDQYLRFLKNRFFKNERINHPPGYYLLSYPEQQKMLKNKKKY